MREIKFRAWDRSAKRMYHVADMSFGSEGCLIVRTTDGNVFTGLKNAKEYELMQYTGLKDKNGKEIYEGDIVKLCDTNPILFRVETILARYGYKTVFKLLDDGTIAQCYFLDKCEVVGNIHDNPNC